jgi:hypothetical protein
MVEIQNYASQLRTMGVVIDDDMEVARVISSLMDNKFRNFREAWRSVEVGKQTTAQLLSRLKTWELEDEQAAKAKHSNESPKAYAAGKPNKQKKSKEELAELKKKTKCHFCKRKGHWKSECPENDKKKADSSESASSQKPAAYIAEKVGIHRNEWVNDSGADRHYCGRLDWFKEYEKYSEPKLVMIADNSNMEALGMGTVLVKALINGQWRRIELQNVEYVKGGANLFSENVLLAKGFEVKKDQSGRVIYLKNGKPDIEAQLKDGLQIMRFRPVQNQAFACVKQVVWHQRLAHINSQYLKNTATEGAAFGLEKMNNESFKCEPCMQAKSKKQSYKPSSSDKHYKPGECLHADLAHANFTSYRGNKYFLVIKDEASAFRQVYFQKTKTATVENLKDAINFIANQTGNSVKMFRSDNGTEFKNAEFEKFLSEKGIQFGLNAPHTSESNGMVEREVRIEQEAARAMLIQSQLSEKHWDDAIGTAVYILNRTLSSKNKRKTPFEMVFGKKPSLHHVRTFGCKAFVHKMNNHKKWDAKALECILVGYNSTSKNYILYVPSKGSYIEQAKHVDFMENCEDSNEIDPPVKGAAKDNYEDEDIMEIHREIEYMDEDGLIPAQDLHDVSADTSGISSWADDVEMDQSQQQEEPESSRPKRNRKQVQKYQAGFQATAKYLEPTSYKEAVSCPDAEEWKEAMDSEIRSQQAIGTWHLVKRPRNKKVLQNRWVYKIKTDTSGNIEKYKARLVVKGCHQVEGVDYEETFAPVSRYETIRILLSAAAERGWQMLQFDIETAFLNSTLEDEVYMEQPQGYSTGHDQVCRLDRGVYGLKQAPRKWHETIKKKLTKMGFVALDSDPCVYRKEIHGQPIFIVIYVDDGLIMGSSLTELKDEVKSLKEEFKVTVQPVKRFLGIEIIENENGIFLHQQKYIRDLLQKFGMSECKIRDIPMQPGLQLQRMHPADTEYEFQELIGSLLFLARCTRPDITYAVHYLSRFFSAYSKQHWDEAKKILQYLQGTKDLGILYKKQNCNDLCGYVDADYGSDLESRKSTTGCVFLFNESPVIWMSKRQTCVALSSTESEYVALAQAGKESVWLNRIYAELDMPIDAAICLKTDSQSAIKLAKNPEYHDKTKHIDIRHHYIRWLVDSERVSLEYVPDQSQPADILTKSVVKDKFIKKRQLMGMQDLPKEPLKRKALSSVIVDPKRPNMYWSLALMLILCCIQGGDSKLFRESNPVIWRKSSDPVFTGFQAVTMDLKLISPCSLISVKELSPRVSNALISKCESTYKEIFLDNLESICPKEKAMGHLEERAVPLMLIGVLFCFGIAGIGVGMAGHAIVQVNALKTSQQGMQKEINEISRKVFTNRKLVEKLEKQLLTIASRVDVLTDDLNSFKEKTVELQFLTSYLTNRLMEGRKVLKETGSHWSKGKLTPDLFEFLNFTLPCAEECPIEHGNFHSCSLSVNRDEMLMEFVVPMVNPKLVRVEADQFDLMARNETTTCRLKYVGPLVATISVEEDCVYETRMERPLTNLDLTILSSCKNNSFDESDQYYRIDRCKDSVAGDEKEFIQVKFFNNEYHIYCYGSFYTIGNREVECPETVFALPLSLTFTLNDVIYKGSMLKVIYQEPEDHYLREHIDHHLNKKIVTSNLSAELMKDWTDTKNQIDEYYDGGFWYGNGSWTWSEIVLLVLLTLMLGAGLVKLRFCTKFLKKYCCASKEVKDKTPEGAPLNKPAEGSSCGHHIVIT